MNPSILNIFNSRYNARVALKKKLANPNFTSTPEMEAFLKKPIRSLTSTDYKGKAATIDYFTKTKAGGTDLETLRRDFFRDYLQREAKTNSDWTNKPFALISDIEKSKRRVMNEILEKQYDLESRKYERVDDKKRKHHNYEDYETDFMIRYCQMELFQELDQLRNQEMVEYADFIRNEIYNDTFWNGASAPTEEELDVFHGEAMRYFKETEVPPR